MNIPKRHCWKSRCPAVSSTEVSTAIAITLVASAANNPETRSNVWRGGTGYILGAQSPLSRSSDSLAVAMRVKNAVGSGLASVPARVIGDLVRA